MAVDCVNTADVWLTSSKFPNHLGPHSLSSWTLVTSLGLDRFSDIHKKGFGYFLWPSHSMGETPIMLTKG